MRWKAYFYLNPEANDKQEETFVFNSRNTPPQIPAMLNFEKRLLNVIENIKFKEVKCWFQQKLSSGIQTNIKKSSDLLIPANKTSNFYKMDSTAYNGLLQKNITTTYKVSPDTTSSIELEAKEIAKRLDLDDRVNTTTKREAFTTLKDHKPNFANNPVALFTQLNQRLAKSANKSLTK